MSYVYNDVLMYRWMWIKYQNINSTTVNENWTTYVLIIVKGRDEHDDNGMTNKSHKSHCAPVPYPTIHHFERKCAHFFPEWYIVGHGTGTLWDLWICSIVMIYNGWSISRSRRPYADTEKYSMVVSKCLSCLKTIEDNLVLIQVMTWAPFY